MITGATTLGPLLGCGLMAGVMVVAVLAMGRGGAGDTSSSEEIAALRREVQDLRADDEQTSGTGPA